VYGASESCLPMQLVNLLSYLPILRACVSDTRSLGSLGCSSSIRYRLKLPVQYQGLCNGTEEIVGAGNICWGP